MSTGAGSSSSADEGGGEGSERKEVSGMGFAFVMVAETVGSWLQGGRGGRESVKSFIAEVRMM